MYFDPRFYETRALSYVARTFRVPVHCNIMEPDFSKPFDQRPEIDGCCEIDEALWAIEVKSHPLSAKSIDHIAAKYQALGYERLKIVAPLFTCQDRGKGRGTKLPIIDLIEYRPDLAPIFEFYSTCDFPLSPHFLEELTSGKHHFRYRMAIRARNANARFRNQTDKRIKSTADLRREIMGRMKASNPPLKVYWSTGRWLSPKDLYFKGRHKLNLYLGGVTVFDIDGPAIHRPLVNCLLLPDSDICPYCFHFAKRHTQRLISFLQNQGYRQMECVFSGRQGFHLYLFDGPSEVSQRQKLAAQIEAQRIGIDRAVTTHQRGMIAFPSSLHAYSMTRSVVVHDLASFTLEKVTKEFSYGPRV